MDRYERLASAFVGLADTLVADYDVVELAQQLIDSSMTLLPIAAAGILLGDGAGELHVFASSSEQTRLLELLQVEADMGPCLQAYRTGQGVFVEDLSVDPQRWPAFSQRAAEYNFGSVSALPLRLRDERVGALNLFRTDTGALPPTDVAVGQALADVATIGILHQRILTRSELVNQQLQTALNTRVVIEQAKGVLSERGAVDMDTAFKLLRAHARRTQQRLADLSASVVAGADTATILDAPSN
ncbi:GAF and ANTAR domain-containing protein [Mycolicibacterium komossense]|uniref:GAF and ANTAR domain-containing protein n=1 Tax=Mycolicibacterium komossense TaxID=1779 RepID=A0ABT3CC13_9MYCO|nr:GAF and ANTAR domain-containing protein [Mycolicibacterium komossense]MCV7227024.1 GAF and ANTAR domain-containing protein [Mycolicibacterium komossense]